MSRQRSQFQPPNLGLLSLQHCDEQTSFLYKLASLGCSVTGSENGLTHQATGSDGGVWEEVMPSVPGPAFSTPSRVTLPCLPHDR